MEVTEAMDSRTPLAALSPSQQNTEAGDVDFSKLTPSQFGISTDSFLPSSKIKDKSRVAQLKGRRRSTIGVRGSPETNSLICFRAKQAAKTPPRTPQLFQGSPFLSCCDSLKKKMAAFQCLMEEDEEKDGQKKNEESESAKSILAKDSKNGNENTLTMQSPPTSMTPPPSKKRCWAPQGECEDKKTETLLPYPTFTSQQEQGLKCFESQSQRPHSDLDSDAKNELLSLPMLSKPEIKLAVENVVSSVSKKKRVRFGAPLSPEFFDKTLPPSTPLQKGGTPKCPPSSTGPKLSLLKTPQRSDPLPQPDFSSPQSNGASPVLVIDRCSAGLVYSDEVFEEIEKISFPNMEDEPPSYKQSENCKDVLSAEDQGQPQAEDTEVMNVAFQEDVPSDSQTEEKLPCPNGDQPLAFSAVKVDQESSVSSEQTLSSKPSTESTHSRSRKRKQPGENEPEKRRSSRTAAASASGKMKNTGVKRRFGNKEVDRSLYGKRDYASKNPLLSPIFETASTSLNSTPTPAQSGKQIDGEQDCIQTLNVPQSKTVRPMETACTWTNENEQTLSSNVSDTTDNQSDMGVTCLEPSVGARGPTGRRSSGSKTSKASRDSGRPVHRRRSSGAAKRKELGSPAISSSTESGGETGKQDTESQKPTESAGLNPVYQDSPDRPVRDVAECSENKEIEAVISCVVPNEDSMNTESLEQKTPSNKKRGLVQKALKSPPGKLNVVVEQVVESGQSERFTDDTSESNAGPTEPSLAPWQQADFNIDDILKPVAKSRGSVRRSLRNRRSVDLQAAGLAWVDHTSPELSKVGRRRTRGRLSGVSEPFVPQASVELTPNLGE
ncbi:cell division cycle-associated protein 2 isoform X1 [Cyprinus carpio]|uniref:Cell division cycle-associated protein 2 isoform X1 n=1 Tax=Cyprinus carpio TaxID=7962 RepID=A0A9Q9XWH1_CYPCA|nr:cell division cycle-associated protein 2 isoform X1 [Cyprinus carpio]XP_042609289.1 cell division cycle-associated protein 2 isoform X1 [Cyprinus carpio]